MCERGTARHGNGAHSLPSEDAMAAARAIAEARERLVSDPAGPALMDLLDQAVDVLGEIGVMQLAHDVVARNRN
jgi:hypothetical protein